MDLLPEELLADILRRLPPRPLAVVSKDLRAVVDGRGLLAALARRVPRGLRGVFINYVGQDRPYLFSRPERAAPRVDAELRFLEPIGWGAVAHHCNGLLFFLDWSTLYVCNPATRRWARLPPLPEGGGGDDAHLVFDPTVSLHYEVISFSEVPCKPRIPIQPGIERPSWCQTYSVYTAEEIEGLPSSLRARNDQEVETKGSVEWPPSTYMAQVFSSRTGRWEERAYVREDDVAVTLLDVWSDPWGPDSETLTYNSPRCNAVHWRGALYLHCHGGYVMRLSLLEQKYRVIKTPSLDNLFTQPKLDIDDFLSKEGPYRSKAYCLREFQMKQKSLDREKPATHLGKSEHGIYYTALIWHQLRVWVLSEASESRPMPEWELKHAADIRPSFWRHYMREDREEIRKPWSLDRGERGSDDQVDCGWDSSDDSVISVEGEDGIDNGDKYCKISRRMDFLGYHPRKEIAFLGDHFEGFAYHLSTSKLQYLGTFYPAGCCHVLVAATHETFIYTPCMDDLLPDRKRNTRHDVDLEEEENEDEVDTDEDVDLEEEENEDEVDTDENEDLEEDEVDTDEDEDLEKVEDEDFKGSEEDGDNDKDEEVDC